jgi:hypothetical protein
VKNFFLAIFFLVFLLAGCIEPITDAGTVTKLDLGNHEHLVKVKGNDFKIRFQSIENNTLIACGLVSCNVDVVFSPTFDVELRKKDFFGFTKFDKARFSSLLVGSLREENRTVWKQVQSTCSVFDENTTSFITENCFKSVVFNESERKIVFEEAVFPMQFKAGENYTLRFVFNRKAELGASDDLIVSAVGVNFTEYAWWNNSWSKKQQVNITNGIVNYQIRLQVNTSGMIANGSLQSDCDDLRFTSSNESTELPMWFETQLGVTECNTQNTTVWIKDIEAGNHSVYMYYDNSAVSNASNGSAVALNSACFDDFLGTSLSTNWYPFKGAGGGSTSVSNGEVLVRGKVPNNGLEMIETNTTCTGGYQSMWRFRGKQNTSATNDFWNSMKVGDTSNNNDAGQARFMGIRNGYKTTTRMSGAETNTVITSNSSYRVLEIARVNSSFTRFFQQATTYDSKANVANHTANIFTADGFFQIGSLEDPSWVTVDWVMAVNYTDVNAPSYSFGTESSNDAAPNVSSNAPADGFVFANGNASFNGTATDDKMVSSISLFTNITGSWTANQTNSSPFNNTLTNFDVVGINSGTFLWGLRTVDNSSQVAWSSNRTFTVPSAGTNFSIYGTDGTWVLASSRNPKFRCYPTQKDCEPVNQSSSSNLCGFRVCNNGTNWGNTGIGFNLSSTMPNGLSIFCDDDNTTTGATVLNITNQYVWTGSLQSNSCQNFCCWANFSYPAFAKTYPNIVVRVD